MLIPNEPPSAQSSPQCTDKIFGLLTPVIAGFNCILTQEASCRVACLGPRCLNIQTLWLRKYWSLWVWLTWSIFRKHPRNGWWWVPCRRWESPGLRCQKICSDIFAMSHLRWGWEGRRGKAFLCNNLSDCKFRRCQWKTLCGIQIGSKAVMIEARSQPEFVGGKSWTVLGRVVMYNSYGFLTLLPLGDLLNFGNTGNNR